MPPQLRCRDLRPGDILLQLSSGSLASKAIQFGQKMTSGVANSAFVHAGIMFDSTYFIEALGAGISAADLRVGNSKYSYHAYRCTNPPVASGAATCAKMMFDIHQSGHKLPYSVEKAIDSIFGPPGKAATPSQLDDLLDAVLHGRSCGFFCSQFVVYVYQFVAAQCGLLPSAMFNVSDAKASPALLASKLKASPFFSEIGYLEADQR